MIMNIVWDESKERTLYATRGILLSEIADLILQEQYVALLENPSRPDQMVIVLPYHGYMHVVPFMWDAEGNMVLKTAYPSRKFQHSHGGGNEGQAD
jgi:hypothetical protein